MSRCVRASKRAWLTSSSAALKSWTVNASTLWCSGSTLRSSLCPQLTSQMNLSSDSRLGLATLSRQKLQIRLIFQLSNSSSLSTLMIRNAIVSFFNECVILSLFCSGRVRWTSLWGLWKHNSRILPRTCTICSWTSFLKTVRVQQLQQQLVLAMDRKVHLRRKTCSSTWTQ